MDDSVADSEDADSRGEHESTSNAEPAARYDSFLSAELSELRDDPSRWFFLTGNRLVVAGIAIAMMGALISLLQLSEIVAVRNTGSLFYLFGSLLSGNLTLLSLVISINQLVLSRQLGSPGELREQINNVTEYRKQVIDEAELDVAPVTPSEFLKVLLQHTRREVQRLGGLTAGTDHRDLREDVNAFTTEVTEHVDRITLLLEQSGIGTFNALSAALTTNYAQLIHQARTIETNYGEDLHDAGVEGLDRTVHRLQQIDVARQYFKTLYMQAELSYLSRVLLYVGIPAELVAVGMLLVFSSSPDSTSLATLPVGVLPAFVTIGLAPLAVLFAFVLRIAVVTQRTAAITPFTTPEQETQSIDLP